MADEMRASSLACDSASSPKEQILGGNSPHDAFNAPDPPPQRRAEKQGYGKCGRDARTEAREPEQLGLLYCLRRAERYRCRQPREISGDIGGKQHRIPVSLQNSAKQFCFLVVGGKVGSEAVIRWLQAHGTDEHACPAR